MLHVFTRSNFVFIQDLLLGQEPPHYSDKLERFRQLINNNISEYTPNLYEYLSQVIDYENFDFWEVLNFYSLRDFSANNLFQKIIHC